MDNHGLLARQKECLAIVLSGDLRQIKNVNFEYKGTTASGGSDELERLQRRIKSRRQPKQGTKVAAVDTIDMPNLTRWMLSPNWKDAPRFTAKRVRRHSAAVYKMIEKHIPEPEFIMQPCGRIYYALSGPPSLRNRRGSLSLFCTSQTYLTSRQT